MWCMRNVLSTQGSVDSMYKARNGLVPTVSCLQASKLRPCLTFCQYVYYLVHSNSHSSLGRECGLGLKSTDRGRSVAFTLHLVCQQEVGTSVGVAAVSS